MALHFPEARETPCDHAVLFRKGPGPTFLCKDKAISELQSYYNSVRNELDQAGALHSATLLPSTVSAPPLLLQTTNAAASSQDCRSAHPSSKGKQASGRHWHAYGNIGLACRRARALSFPALLAPPRRATRSSRGWSRRTTRRQCASGSSTRPSEQLSCIVDLGCKLRLFM